MTVTFIACFVCWVMAQNAEKHPDVVPTQLLLERLQALHDADQYEEVIHFSDSIAMVFKANGLRTDWYKALRIKTIAQKDHGRAHTALVELMPIVQAQTLDDSITAKLYGLLGFSCLNAREFEQGAWHYERCLVGLLRHRCILGIGGAYMNLGYALKEQGDYRAARQYYLTALPLLRKEGNAWNLSEALINLGDISRYLYDYEAARDYYRKSAIEYPDNEGRLNANLGWAYADEGLYREALEHFQESCKQAPCAADLARIMGRCAEALGDTTEANLHYRLALENAGTARDSGITRSYIGHTLLGRQQPDAALQIFQQALHNLFPSIRPDNPTDNPSVGLTADFWPIEILRGKALSLRARYAQTGAVQDLHHALSAVSTAMAALDTLRSNMRNETSGQDAVDYAYATYETGIRIALETERAEPGQAYMSKAYEIAEHAKSNVLKNKSYGKRFAAQYSAPG